MISTKKTALTNVRVFDGDKITEPTTVVIDGEVIGTDPSDAQIIDTKGGILLPGLIDAHIHMSKSSNFKNCARNGITTALDMGILDTALLPVLKDQKGTTDLLSAGMFATIAGTGHAIALKYRDEDVIKSPTDAAPWVAKRIAEGSDYIKLIIDEPGLDQAMVDALAAEAREQKRLSIAHACSVRHYNMAQNGKVDIVTHVPTDDVLPPAEIARMIDSRRVSVPTLTILGMWGDHSKNPEAYKNAKENVSLLYKAGVPILAGTDVNDMVPEIPVKPPHGETMHQELEALVEAGLSNVDALRAATSLPAKHFQLEDRGVIRAGCRADLVLLQRNPLEDIRATRSIKQVWCAGIEVL